MGRVGLASAMSFRTIALSPPPATTQKINLHEEEEEEEEEEEYLLKQKINKSGKICILRFTKLKYTTSVWHADHFNTSIR